MVVPNSDFKPIKNIVSPRSWLIRALFSHNQPSKRDFPHSNEKDVRPTLKTGSGKGVCDELKVESAD
jgi:hypothetical protein